ncbi:MAG: hypothetical protein JXA94_03315, partial [Parachlamydiales bacterium]|nr:hypothetical protein [Parachlamydiales bacterium]
IMSFALLTGVGAALKSFATRDPETRRLYEEAKKEEPSLAASLILQTKGYEAVEGPKPRTGYGTFDVNTRA